MAAHRDQITGLALLLLRAHFLMGGKEVSKTIILLNNRISLKVLQQVFRRCHWLYVFLGDHRILQGAVVTSRAVFVVVFLQYVPI